MYLCISCGVLEMWIIRDVVNALNETICDLPPETGGVLGSDSDNVVTHYVHDVGVNDLSKCCSYTPNVGLLNKCISEWCGRGIRLMGVFHTHFAGVETLSQADIVYIESIMRAMPQEINQLFFPIYVLPDRNIIVYKYIQK